MDQISRFAVDCGAPRRTDGFRASEPDQSRFDVSPMVPNTQSQSGDETP
jgi:hypothetical protein